MIWDFVIIFFGEGNKGIGKQPRDGIVQERVGLGFNHAMESRGSEVK